MPRPVLGNLSADELATYLAQLEEQLESGQRGRGDDATAVELKAELDTFLSHIRTTTPASPFELESACQRVTAMVQKYGLDSDNLESARIESSAETDNRAASSEATQLGKLGVYELIAKIGEGGMGAVYKARHSKLDKVVAIKVLPSERMQDPSAVARFGREMRAVGKLEHPNIVRAMDAGEAGGMHFLVMEYVEGIDLSQLVKQHGALPIADACELIRQAAVGLDEAFDNGMVHRDIKPSNLILASRRRKPPVVKILDMGLALLTEAQSTENEGLTTTGQLMGTLDYMAPEQGGDSKSVDIRADIYALGATLYRLLCGEVIYHGAKYGTPVQKMMALAVTPAPAIQSRRAGIPDKLAAIVHRMLEKNPSDRFATPQAIVDALEPFCAGANLRRLLEETPQSAPPVADSALSVTELGASHSCTDTEVTNAAPAEVKPIVAESTAVTSLPTRPTIAAVHPQTQTAARRKPPKNLLIAGGAGLLGILALLGAIVFFFQTPHGTLRVEINDPEVEVLVKGSDIVLRKADKEEVTLAPGDKTLVVKRGDFTFETNQFELKKGATTIVKVELLPGKVQVALADGESLGTKSLMVPPKVAGNMPPKVGTTSTDPSVAGRSALLFERGDQVVVEKVPYRGTTVVTLEAWVSVDLSDDERIQNIVRTPNGEICMKRKAIRFYTHHGHVDVPDAVPAMRRVHVAGVNDGKVRRLYLNGKLIGKTDDPGEAPPSQPDLALRIGFFYFRGVIDTVRVSNVARYDAEFTPPTEFKTDKDTFALYLFNEGQGDVLKDSSGNGYHGKITGAKWVNVFDNNRSANSEPTALRTAGTNSYVELPLVIEDARKPLTLETWLLHEDKDWRFILRSGDNTLQLTRTAQGQIAWTVVDASGKSIGIRGRLPFVAGTYGHIAATINGDELNLYVDGQRLETGPARNGMPNLAKFPSFVGWARPADLGRHDPAGTIGGVRISKVVRYRDAFTPARQLPADADTLALYLCKEGQGDVLKDSSGNNHHGKIIGANWVKGSSVEFTNQAEVARWLLENKKLTLIGFEVDGQVRYLNALPTGPCKVRELNFHPANNGGNLLAEDIPRLAVFTDLESLDLSRAPLTDASLASLAPLKKLRRLNLMETGVTSASVATILAFPQLEYLHGPSTDDWLKPLAGMPTIRSLDFSRQEISPQAMEWFKQYPNLAELRFVECGEGWTSDKLAPLTDCKLLSKLEVGNMPIDDTTVEIFSSLKGLVELNVTGTKLTEEGVKKIAAALPKCKITWTGGVSEPTAK